MPKRVHVRKPCPNCPYRKDSPVGLWHKAEFERLLETEQDIIGAAYQCHKQIVLENEERGFCAGWLLDQKKRDLPSNALRIMLIRDADARAAYENVSGDGIELFDSVEEMCRANGVRIPEKEQQPVPFP